MTRFCRGQVMVGIGDEHDAGISVATAQHPPARTKVGFQHGRTDIAFSENDGHLRIMGGNGLEIPGERVKAR